MPSRRHRELTTSESCRRSTRTSPGGRRASDNRTESDTYTTHGKPHRYGHTHLDRKGSQAVFSVQVKPCLAYTLRPSSSVPWSRCGTQPNISTLKKCTRCYMHVTAARDPGPSNGHLYSQLATRVRSLAIILPIHLYLLSLESTFATIYHNYHTYAYKAERWRTCPYTIIAFQ